MPSWEDMDPVHLREHLGRLHLLDVLGPGQFRFRVYGSDVKNPDAQDMTGLTTRDYATVPFGELVTRHYQACVEAREPVYHEVAGSLDGLPYHFRRLTLPLSSDGESVDKLLASPLPIRIVVSSVV